MSFDSSSTLISALQMTKKVNTVARLQTFSCCRFYPYFEGMVNRIYRIYPPELRSNKANTSDTEAPFLDLYLSISNGFVSSKIYDKRDD